MMSITEWVREYELSLKSGPPHFPLHCCKCGQHQHFKAQGSVFLCRMSICVQILCWSFNNIELNLVCHFCSLCCQSFNSYLPCFRLVIIKTGHIALNHHQPIKKMFCLILNRLRVTSKKITVFTTRQNRVKIKAELSFLNFLYTETTALIV